jgi:hypothetical protein
MQEFLDRFRRVNLIDEFPGKSGKGDRFPMDEARRGAIRLIMHGAFAQGPVVLLGAKVAEAFEFEIRPPFSFMPLDVAPHGICVCPHPSGVNRWYNEPRNLRIARRFWRSLVQQSI